MKTIIVDNEKNIRNVLKKLCERFLPSLEIVGEAASIAETERLINENDIDLIFLDIQLDDGLGIQLLEKYEKPSFQVIFITAYDQYAVKAFKYSAIDYLLKPIDTDDLVKAVHKAIESVKNKSHNLKLEALLNNFDKSKSQRLILSDNHNLTAIDFNDILFFEADGAYTHIHSLTNKYTSTKNLKHFENLLKEAPFFRCHHSHLVNLDHFERYDKSLGVLYLDNQEEIPVSFRKRESLQEKLRTLYF